METSAKRRASTNLLDITIAVVSIALFLLLISYPILLWEGPERIDLLFLPLCLIPWALSCIKSRSLIPGTVRLNNLAAALIIALSSLVAFYFYTQYPFLSHVRQFNNNNVDFIIGGIAILLIIFGTWKTSGITIPIVTIIFVIYAFFGNYFPGVLHHTGLSWTRVLQLSAVGIDGIFGNLPQTGFTMVVIFIFFAGMVQGFGGLDFIINLSKILLRRFRWGLPQIAVIGSLIFGTFSGSAAANVAGVGTFTIPMMKRFGIKPEIAAAIESVASTGGQIMPPIMGVAAFLMSDFLGVPYIRIVAMGFVPAIIWYLFVAFSAYIMTRRTLNSSTSKEAEEAWKKVGDFHWAAGIPIVVPIVVLLYVMAVLDMAVSMAGVIMVFSYVLTRLVYDLIFTGRSLSMFKQFGGKVLKGITSGISSTVSIMMLLSVMGIVARVLVSTGLSQKLAFFMVDFSGGHIWLLLPLILIVCVAFGMAVSTVVAYLLVVLLAAPALQQLGIPVASTHFTVFYLSILSAITPPVAIACAVAASVAKSSYMRTCWESMKLGVPLFVLPFVFIAKPDLIAANIATTPLAALETFAGLLPVSYGLQGEFKGIFGNLLRVACIALGALGIFGPEGIIAWLCLAAGVALTFMLLTRKDKMAALAK
ncbi:MAG: TRAP transporter fused permease subunit [Dehalococcoidales bacterium]|nr:TRAP transporter fused permease subunit [Dehalococcoidales bacterium]